MTERREHVEKQQQIISMFNEISGTYDLLNRLLSFGIDKRWRKVACERALMLLGRNDLHIVDVATGTGDMLSFWKGAAQKASINVTHYDGVDPSVGMLGVARNKIDFATFTEGKATELPFEDNSADIISISYGIRNVVERQAAWQEFERVLKPGGLLVVLEFTKPEKENIMGLITKWYMRKAIPAIGKLISKHSNAYTYLPDSINAFETTAMLKDEMLQAGFDEAHIKGYSFEISTLFIMKKRG